MNRISITVIFILILICYQNAVPQTDTSKILPRYSIRAAYGSQSLTSTSEYALYGDIADLNKDKLHPIDSFNKVDADPVLHLGVAFYHITEKSLVLSVQFERTGLTRSSSFIFHATDKNGIPSELSSTIETRHRLHSFILGSGWFFPFSKNGGFVFEANILYYICSLNETIRVGGFREVNSDITGNGVGGRAGAGIAEPLFGPLVLRLNASFTYSVIWYNGESTIYSGDSVFGLGRFNFSAGLEYFLFE